MYNDNGVKNALENKNYSFSLLCVKRFCLEGRVVDVNVVDLMVPIVKLKPKNWFEKSNPFLACYLGNGAI